MIEIRLNGDQTEVPAGQTVAGLLDELGRDPRAVAVERNGRILPRDRYGSANLEADDRLEIVQFVQGG